MVDSYRDNTFDDSHFHNQSMEQPHDNIQIAILGSSYVGKTSIFHKIVEAKNQLLEQGITNEHKIIIQKNEQEIMFNLVDFPGNLDCDQIIHKSVGFFLVYSLSDQQSFLRMQDLYQKIVKTYGKKINKKIIVIGNKNDLPRNEKFVKSDEIRQFYEQNKCECLKLPSKNNENAESQMLKKLIENILNESNSSMSHSNILTKSVIANSPYATHFMTETGVSQNKKPSSQNNESTKSSKDCPDRCKCSIF